MSSSCTWRIPILYWECVNEEVAATNRPHPRARRLPVGRATDKQCKRLAGMLVQQKELVVGGWWGRLRCCALI